VQPLNSFAQNTQLETGAGLTGAGVLGVGVLGVGVTGAGFVVVGVDAVGVVLGVEVGRCIALQPIIAAVPRTTIKENAHLCRSFASRASSFDMARG
jgi:hypothetical protein